MMINAEITDKIIAAALRIHSALGPGLLESAYREFLFYELELDGWSVEKEKPLPVVYRGKRIDHGYRLDILVQNTVVVELKTVETLLRIHQQQLLTYLRLG